MVRWRLWKHCSDIPIYSDCLMKKSIKIPISLRKHLFICSFHSNSSKMRHFEINQNTVKERNLNIRRWHRKTKGQYWKLLWERRDDHFFLSPYFFSSLSWPFLCCCKDQKRPKENKSQRRRLKVYYYSNKWQKLFSHKVFSLLIPANEGCKTLTLAKGHKECEENCEIIYHVFFFFQRSSSVGNAWFR